VARIKGQWNLNSGGKTNRKNPDARDKEESCKNKKEEGNFEKKNIEKEASTAKKFARKKRPHRQYHSQKSRRRKKGRGKDEGGSLTNKLWDNP